MDPALLIELYGYLGTVLVVVSMLMASIIKLRVINTIGNIISGSYGFIIGSFPLALMNGCLLIINIYNLYKLLKTKQKYDLVGGSESDAFVQYFLTRYQDDIKRYFPAFAGKTAGADVVYMVCCDGNPAGILLGKDEGNGVVDVLLDYSIPAYRDCSVGAYLYSELADRGVNQLTFSQSESDAHGAYLSRMGFAKERGVYTKKLR